MVSGWSAVLTNDNVSSWLIVRLAGSISVEPSTMVLSGGLADPGIDVPRPLQARQRGHGEKAENDAYVSRHRFPPGQRPKRLASLH